MDLGDLIVRTIENVSSRALPPLESICNLISYVGTPTVSTTTVAARAPTKKIIHGPEPCLAGPNFDVVDHVGTNVKKNTTPVTSTSGGPVGPGGVTEGPGNP